MNDLNALLPEAERPEERLIGDREFAGLVSELCWPLLELADGLTNTQPAEPILTRPLIGRLLLESKQIEALLDEYGACRNRQWSRFRSLIAVLKNMARFAEVLACIRRRLPAYRLLPVRGDFASASSARLHQMCGGIREIAARLLDEAQALGIERRVSARASADFAEKLPPGRLAHTSDERQGGDAASTVTHLATEFLNLAAEADWLGSAAQLAAEEWSACFPDPVSEERLRQLVFRFHSLQSLYDTHVAATGIESSDAKLPILRGHATVVYHLLDLATDLAHFYERHLGPLPGDEDPRRLPGVDRELIMATLFGYALAFASDYLAGGQSLCQDILRRYAELAELQVPVPTYRGFHVRPSNLVARIVAHYGSAVVMDLGGTRFDAASPFELFRANETINAGKRRWLAGEIARVRRPGEASKPADTADAVRTVIQQLAGEGRVVLYRQPLHFSPEIGQRAGGVLENATAEIAHLQATGQLDIRTDLTVTFIGDRRVLADLDLLARHGYGEDAFGNNVTLPSALAYLRR